MVEEASISIRCITVSGAELARVSIPTSGTVSVLKQAIASQGEAPTPAAMSLLFGRQLLRESSVLADNGIVDGDTVQVVVQQELWKLLVRHRVRDGFFRPGELSRSGDDLHAPLFAELDIDYEPFRKDGEFVFKIVWPCWAEDSREFDGDVQQNWMAWAQASTPLQKLVEAYEALSVPYPGTGRSWFDPSGQYQDHAFRGVSPSLDTRFDEQRALLDGNAGMYCSFYAVGGIEPWGSATTIPGPVLDTFREVPVQEVELWIARDPGRAREEIAGAPEPRL